MKRNHLSPVFGVALLSAAALFAIPSTAYATTLLNEAFSEANTAPNSWFTVGNACATAGTSATPATSIPPCGSAAARDPAGQGALQLTAGTTSQIAMVVGETPVATGAGLQITFTDYSFNGSSPAADGMVLFLADASKPMPTAVGSAGGSLGYASTTGTPGIANGFIGIAFDEYGSYSAPTEGRNGGPGQTPETIALRGAASANYPYLGGYANAAGAAASLPFDFDQTSATTRPSTSPTVRIVLTPTGTLTVAIDHHDGNGFVPYVSQKISGVSGQPAVPAQVYVGMTGSTGGLFARHQIGGLVVSSTVAPTTFAPTQIPNLMAWYDPSNVAGLTTTAGSVSTIKDLSGNNNAATQTTAALEPTFVAQGIDGLGSLAFNGKQYAIGTNASFSTKLFDESTVFAVSNQTAGTPTASLLWSGASASNPRWNLSLTGTDAAFDFDANGAGERSQLITTTGPAFWTASGSVSKKYQYIKKDGYLLSSTTSTGSTVSGNYPLALGAIYAPGSAASAAYTGALGEVLVFNRQLATTESTEVEGYLACKWGMQNRLPANHPYRNVCPQGNTPTPIATPTPVAAALSDPQQLVSHNGQLVFNVTANANANTGSPQLTYNGSAIPPTLRLVPGDTLVVNLTNNLPTPPSGSGYLDDTNLHFHGLHVSPNAPGDDSIDMLAMPGQSLHYQIAIPTNHPSGLYWYHSHAHGEAERQNLSGMSGALVVDGISQYVPEAASIPERILIVRDAQPAGTALPAANRLQIAAMRWAMQHASGRTAATTMSHGMAMSPASSTHGTMSMNVSVRGRTTAATRNPYVTVDPRYRRLARPLIADSHCTATETATHALTVNGQTMPTIGIRPGEKQFWRLVNAGSDTYLDIAVDNTTMQIVALDGIPLASVGNALPTVSHYVVPPASRVEFLVRGPAAGTTSYLRTNCFDAGSAGVAMPAATLATINSANSPTDNVARSRERVTASLRAHPRHYHTASYVRALATTGPSQTITYSDQNTIDGQAYDPGGAPLFYAQSGTTALWTIVNNSAQVHTFHIHQIHFVVQSVTGGTASDQSNVGQELDNVNVPASTSNGPGSVTLKMDFTDPSIVGTFLLHCHILSHEDGGMMAKVRVGTSAPMTTSASTATFASPSAAPQTVTVSGGAAPYSVSGCTNVANATVTGSSVAISPAGAGGCALSIADTSGLVASVSISVSAAAAVVTVSPNKLSFTTPTAAAENASIGGGTAPYAAVGCNGIATLATSGGTLTVTPTAAGQCTATISDSANDTNSVAVSVNAASTSGVLDNVTFHQNNARQGWYQHETALTVANVGSSAFSMIGTLAPPSGGPGFGKIFAQPLFASNETVANGTAHNLVVIATTTDQVYAYDDQTLAVVWQRSFTNPPNVVQQSWSDAGCYDVNPDIGIMSTPVIDRALDEMFVVVPTKESGVFHIRLHAISLKSGQDTMTPVEVSASVALSGGGVASTDPEFNNARSALLEANGSIYVSLASHCDDSADHIHGWELAYSATSLKPTGSAVDVTDGSSSFYLGSVWMAGFGPAADANGNVYFSTGNGPRDGASNFAMSVLELPGNLDITKASSFSPYNAAADSNADQDLGSGGVVLLPDGLSSTYPHLLLQGGKCGVGASSNGTTGCQKYLLNRDGLGGSQANDVGALWHADTGGGEFGGPAYFQDSSGGAHVVLGTGQPISDYNVNVSPVSLSVQASANVGCLECRDYGSQPIVSSNGTQAGTAVAWVLGFPGANGGNVKMYAFDALKMTTLFSGVVGTWNVCNGCSYIGSGMHSVLVANGKVYAPADGTVAVYGVTAATNARTAATNRPTAAVVRPRGDAVARRYVANVATADASNVRGRPRPQRTLMRGAVTLRRAAPYARTQHALFGTIVSVRGAALVVRTRHGQLHVDDTAALRNGSYSSPLFVGKTVLVSGAYDRFGTFHATNVQRFSRIGYDTPPDR